MIELTTAQFAFVSIFTFIGLVTTLLLISAAIWNARKK